MLININLSYKKSYRQKKTSSNGKISIYLIFIYSTTKKPIKKASG